jgi:protein SCO1/2
MRKLTPLLIALLLLLPLLALPLLAHPGQGHATKATKAATDLKLADYEVGNYPLGGDFTLTNQDGGKTSLQDFRGKAVLLAFGYTNCPDVCPATLALFKQVKLALGGDSARLAALFISVDPKRDTPPVLKRFVRQFDPSFKGLTGSQAEVNTLIERYMGKSVLHKSPAAVADEVDHTAFIYLLDPKGKVRYLFTVDAPREVLVAGVHTVLGRS